MTALAPIRWLRFLFGKFSGEVALFLNLSRARFLMFATIYRSIFTRLLAALIVVLVVSPYSEPFATITGTDFAGAGAVDVDGSKLKTSTLEALLPVPIVVVLPGVRLGLDIPISSTVVLDSRGPQRAILRL